MTQPLALPRTINPIPPKPNAEYTRMGLTMLRGLYNRAAEAARPDTVFYDPLATQIVSKIECEYAKHFGKPSTGQVVRAMTIDNVLRHWLTAYPTGQIVALGDGLETQAIRVDNKQMKWLSVDLPEAMALRSRFIPDTDRRRNFTGSALDLRWMDEVNSNEPVFITAAGLLKFFKPIEVRTLISAIAGRFANAEIVFDVIPRLVSEFSVRGWLVNGKYYTEPTMPFGLDRHERESLKAWHPNISDVRDVPFVPVRGTRDVIVRPTLRKQPFIGDHVFWLAHVRCRAVRTMMKQ